MIDTNKKFSTEKMLILGVFVAVLAGCGGDGGDSVSSSTEWFSNGSVLKSINRFNAAGELTSAENCEWRSVEKELHCIGNHFFNQTESSRTEFFNAEGRFELVAIDNAFFTRSTYADGKLTQQTRSQSETGAVDSIYQYNWQGNTLLSVTVGVEHNGEFDESTHVVDWRDGRINSIQIDGEHALYRTVYDYSTIGILQSMSFESRVSVAEDWLHTSSVEFSYDMNGNIDQELYKDDQGNVGTRYETTWQKVGEPLENRSLTPSRIPYT